jgi:hypothetical protein
MSAWKLSKDERVLLIRHSSATEGKRACAQEATPRDSSFTMRAIDGTPTARK